MLMPPEEQTERSLVRDESLPSCPTRDILGIEVLVLDKASAVERIRLALSKRRFTPMAFLNAHGANIALNNQAYREALAGQEVLADGLGVDTASRWLYGKPFPANLNGTDFIPHLLGELEGPLQIGLYGAAAGHARGAAEVLAADFPHHIFRSLGNGYGGEAHDRMMLSELKDYPVDILLVALGNPKQELWIAENVTAAQTTIPIGVGALFDFLSGSVARAPQWVIKLRMEWLFRLSLEPGRMWRRYVVGNPLFLSRVLRQKFGRSGTRKKA